MIGLVKNTGLVIREGLVKGKGLVKLRPTFPSILSDGNTVKWFDYRGNVTKDGSDLVSVWDNKAGINGIIPGALLQAAPDKQPKWFNADGILFNGIDEFMSTLDFTYEQPEQIYMVFKQVTWVVNNYVFDASITNRGSLRQSGVSPELYTGTNLISSLNNNLAVDTFGIVRILFNIANSKFKINETAEISGDFGTLDMLGFTLGGKTGATFQRAHIQVKEIILRKIADTAQDNQDIYDYLANKYSI